MIGEKNSYLSQEIRNKAKTNCDLLTHKIFPAPKIDAIYIYCAFTLVLVLKLLDLVGQSLFPKWGMGLISYTCQLFRSQRREIFFLPSARVSEDDPTIAKDFRKLPRKFRRIPKF